MHVGVDLGTTYCCVAHLDDDGTARVIPSASGEQTTPSTVWFDGKQAFVGKRANEKKVTSGEGICEFVKQDIGRPVEIPPNLYESDDPDTPSVAAYDIGGFKYGAAGISAIILRRLKKDALAYLRKIGRLDRELQEKNIELDAVITVPASFGEKERQETKLAGYAAGFNVIGIVNEPTAAALAYGLIRKANQRIMVFDLGGGTLDVTVLRVRDGDPHVVSTVGHNKLGGRDWDALIEQHIYDAFRRQNGCRIPDDRMRVFEVQELALKAKLELSERSECTVSYVIDEGELLVTLYRSAPSDDDDLSMDPLGDAFYFDQRASELLSRCRVICEAALTERLPSGEKRTLEWADIDEIVLAGGSCRMPMIHELLEKISGRRIHRQLPGFDYDTAIACGAALYGRHRARVKDVLSHGLGVKVMQDGRYCIEYLIEKDTPLPASAQRTYRAGPSALLEVYEGESTEPDSSIVRGQLSLDNPDGHVAIAFDLDTNGILRVTAAYPVDDAGTARMGDHLAGGAMPPVRKEMELKNDLYMYDRRAVPLRDKIQSLSIN